MTSTLLLKNTVKKVLLLNETELLTSAYSLIDYYQVIGGQVKENLQVPATY